MESLSLTTLYIILFALIIVSGFFSASETSMTAINRYRLRHMVRQKNRTAIRVQKLLARLDRMLGVVLIGNTAANIYAAAVATVIGFRLKGDLGVTVGSLILTFVVLIFSEVTPKIFAANHPRKFAFFASIPLLILSKLLYPVVFLVNMIANGLLRLFGVKTRSHSVEHLTTEELSTVVQEAGDHIPTPHQNMLLGILSLEKVSVNDIMIPRNDIVGIDLEDSWESILSQLTHSEHTRLPLFEGDISNIKGILHLRKTLNRMAKGVLKKRDLLAIADPVYFVPEASPLHTQLLNFKAIKKRMGLVVDEYGDVIGLVTLEDILEEIVGEFTTNIPHNYKGVDIQIDGSVLVDAGINVRDLNRNMEWHFNTSGPKTLSGLIIETLEFIPEKPLCLRLSGYPVEVIEVTANTVKQVRVWPKLKV